MKANPLSLRRLRRKLDRNTEPYFVYEVDRCCFVSSEMGLLRKKIDKAISIYGADHVPSGELVKEIFSSSPSVPDLFGPFSEESEESVPDLSGLISEEEEEKENEEKENEEGEERKKDTDEVRPVSETPSEESPYHGGDGNSGECDHAAASPSMKDRMGATEDDCAQKNQSSGSAEDGMFNQRSPNDSGTEGACLDASCGTVAGPCDQSGDSPDGPLTSEDADFSEPTGSDGEDRPAMPNLTLHVEGTETTGHRAESAACDESGEDVSSLDRKIRQEGIMEAIPDVPSDNGEDVSSLAISSSGGKPDELELEAKTGSGGFCAYITDEMRRRARKDEIKDLRTIARSIERLVARLCSGNSEEIPRLDARKLSREVVARRYQIGRARAERGQKKVAIIIADCSGSCSHVANKTLLTAQLLAEQSNGQIIAWATSNELICEDSRALSRSRSLLGESRVSLVNGNYVVPIYQYAKETVREEIGLVIVFGDTHGTNEYRRFCEDGVPLVWLDNYCCSVGDVQPASNRLRSVAKDWKNKPMAWFQGVGDARTAAIALRASIRCAHGHNKT